MIRNSRFILSTIEKQNRSTRIASNDFQRWIIVESEDGSKELIRKTEEVKTASKATTLEQYIKKASFGNSIASISEKFKQDFSNINHLSKEDLSSIGKQVFAEADPNLISELAVQFGYREPEEAFCEDFIEETNPTTANIICNELVSKIAAGIRNTTNIYAYIKETIIPSGVSVSIIKKAIQKGVSKGKIDSLEIDADIFEKIFSQDGYNEKEYKEGYSQALANIPLNHSKSGSYFAGYFSGKDESYKEAAFSTHLPKKIKLIKNLWVFDGDTAEDEGFDFESAGLYGQDTETHIIPSFEKDIYPEEYTLLYRNGDSNGDSIYNLVDEDTYMNEYGEVLNADFLIDPRFKDSFEVME